MDCIQPDSRFSQGTLVIFAGRNTQLGRELVPSRFFEIPQSSGGYAATFVELRYKRGDLEYGVTTPIIISEPKK